MSKEEYTNYENMYYEPFDVSRAFLIFTEPSKGCDRCLEHIWIYKKEDKYLIQRGRNHNKENQNIYISKEELGDEIIGILSCGWKVCKS